MHDDPEPTALDMVTAETLLLADAVRALPDGALNDPHAITGLVDELVADVTVTASQVWVDEDNRQAEWMGLCTRPSNGMWALLSLPLITEVDRDDVDWIDLPERERRENVFALLLHACVRDKTWDFDFVNVLERLARAAALHDRTVHTMWECERLRQQILFVLNSGHPQLPDAKFLMSMAHQPDILERFAAGEGYDHHDHS